MAIRKSTKLQENFVKELAEHPTESATSLALRAGYSPSTAQRITQVTRSLGVQQLAKEVGIDRDSCLIKIAEIFNSKDKRASLEAYKEIAKTLGYYQPTEYNLKAVQDSERKEVFE